MEVFKVSEETLSLTENFLEIIPGKSTKKSYRQGIKLFEEFLGYPISRLIKSLDASNRTHEVLLLPEGEGVRSEQSQKPGQRTAPAPEVQWDTDNAEEGSGSLQD